MVNFVVGVLVLNYAGKSSSQVVRHWVAKINNNKTLHVNLDLQIRSRYYKKEAYSGRTMANHSIECPHNSVEAEICHVSMLRCFTVRTTTV